MNKEKEKIAKRLKKKIANQEKKRIEKLNEARSKYPNAINRILLISNE